MAFTRSENVVRNDWLTWPSWVFFIEGLLIVFCNAVTIAVFWKRRNVVKRASFLLINLAVADLLVGVALLANKVASLPRSQTVQQVLVFSVLVLTCVGSSASISSLAVIAAERAFAVAKPLKHRAAPTSFYRRAVVFVWSVAVILTAMGLAVAFTGRLDLRFIPFTLAVVLLSMIILSYAVIWRHSTQRRMNKHIHANEQEQAKKLATTLAMVTFLSLATWLPLQVTLVIAPGPFEDVFSGFGKLYMALLLLWYSNSLVNPFVYVLRMPDFRQEIKRTFRLGKLCQERRDVIPMGNACALKFGHGGSYRPTGMGAGH